LRLEVSASIDDVRDQMVGDASVSQLQTEHGRKVYARRDLVAYIEERPERKPSRVPFGLRESRCARAVATPSRREG